MSQILQNGIYILNMADKSPTRQINETESLPPQLPHHELGVSFSSKLQKSLE